MRKRSSYRPRAVLQNPLEFVLSGLRPLRDVPGVFLDLQLKNRAALEEVRRGLATNSIVCPGSIISGGEAHRSIIGTRSTIRSFALVEDSILFDDVVIGRGAKVRRAILDKNVVVPDGFTIGMDRELDRSRGLTVSPEGLTIVAKDEDLKRFV